MISERIKQTLLIPVRISLRCSMGGCQGEMICDTQKSEGNYYNIHHCNICDDREEIDVEDGIFPRTEYRAAP